MCIIICPIATAYSMGQIIKLLSICLSLCTLTGSHFLIDFSKIGTDVKPLKYK